MTLFYLLEFPQEVQSRLEQETLFIV